MNWQTFWLTLWIGSQFTLFFWLIWDWAGYMMWSHPEYHRGQLIRIWVELIIFFVSLAALMSRS